jgi:hypothetical protein
LPTARDLPAPFAFGARRPRVRRQREMRFAFSDKIMPRDARDNDWLGLTSDDQR